MAEVDNSDYAWHERVAVAMTEPYPNGSGQLAAAALVGAGAAFGTWRLLSNTIFSVNREYEAGQANVKSIQAERYKLEEAIAVLPTDDTASRLALQNTLQGYNQRISEATAALPVDYMPGLENVTVAPSTLLIGCLGFAAVWKTVGRHSRRALAKRSPGRHGQ